MILVHLVWVLACSVVAIGLAIASFFAAFTVARRHGLAWGLALWAGGTVLAALVWAAGDALSLWRRKSNTPP